MTGRMAILCREGDRMIEQIAEESHGRIEIVCNEAGLPGAYGLIVVPIDVLADIAATYESSGLKKELGEVAHISQFAPVAALFNFGNRRKTYRSGDSYELAHIMADLGKIGVPSVVVVDSMSRTWPGSEVEKEAYEVVYRSAIPSPSNIAFHIADVLESLRTDYAA